MSESRFCPRCGAPVLPEDVFCGECGTALKVAVLPAVISQPVVVPQPVKQPAKPLVNQPVQRKGGWKLTALMVVGGLLLAVVALALLAPDHKPQPSSPLADTPVVEGPDNFHYQHIRSADYDFRLEKVQGDAGFMMDIPEGWMRQEGTQEHELVFKSPDSDPDAQMFLAVMAEPTQKGRSASTVLATHVSELRDLAADAEVVGKGAATVAGSKGQRAVLRYIGPEGVTGNLMTEMLVFQRGAVMYRLELTAPEPLWHTAQQALQQAQASLEFVP
jgi:hypothetical protein